MGVAAFLTGIMHASSLTADLAGVLNYVAGTQVPRPGVCFDETCLGDIATALVDQLYPFLAILGVIFIVVAGIRLMTKSSEDELQTARRSIGMVTAGVVLGVLAQRGLLFEAARDVENGVGAQIVCTEFLGFVSVFEGITGILAIVMVVTTGIRCLASFGSEDTFANMRTVVFGVVLGMFVLLTKAVVFPAIGLSQSGCGLLDTVSSAGFVRHVIALLSTFLGYLIAGAILILVILGIMLILYMGNEEQYSKLKGYLFRVAIGFIVMAMTKFIIDFVII